jgi:polyhydroxyalkanoate synthesis repressor PhaR
MITIRRYSNRKFYNTDSSKYVTLSEIEQLVRSRVEVIVIDNTTKEDITDNTMLQIIANNPKNFGNKRLLKAIIVEKLLQ